MPTRTTGAKYDYSKNNRYALSGPIVNADIDIVQCRVHLKRTSTGNGEKNSPIKIKYHAEVFDYTDTSKGTAEQTMPTAGQPMLLGGVNPQVKIWEGGSADSLDDKPIYQAANVVWQDHTSGADGAYCSIGDVDGTHGTRDEDCYFPCFVS
ncbi:hypothetical protein P7C71_g4274, partial [Lecanoromycetidae sp. Uapishka_2]